MCRCASFILLRNSCKWLVNSDSHEIIISRHGLREGAGRVNFVRVEISPEDGDLSRPLGGWKYKVDQDFVPDWYDAADGEKRTREALREWAKAKLTGWKVKEAFHPINPLDLKRKPLSRKRALQLVAKWRKVSDAARVSVVIGIEDAVGDGVITEVRLGVVERIWDDLSDKIRDRLEGQLAARSWNKVRDYLGDCLLAYIGGLFPNIKNRYGEKKLGANPWRPLLTLWYAGYVPSFDGKTWRLHAGKKAEVVFQFDKKEVQGE